MTANDQIKVILATGATGAFLIVVAMAFFKVIDPAPVATSVLTLVAGLVATFLTNSVKEREFRLKEEVMAKDFQLAMAAIPMGVGPQNEV